MKVKDLLTMAVSIDVYDDVCEELAVAFEGPQPLTAAGHKRFADVLEYEVSLQNSGRGDVTCIVNVDDPDEKTCMRRLRKAKEFFDAAAGYCAADDWDRWFRSEDS